jgi:MFS family permease
MGTSATQSGTVLMPMTITMIGASIISGQLISRTGRYKLPGVLGLAVMTIGMFLLSRMDENTDYLTLIRNMVIIGIGIGPTMPVFTLAAQNAVKMNQLGVVTALTQFARSIGSTIGVALFGSLLINDFGPAFRASLPSTVTSVVPPERLAQLQNPQVLLNPQLADSLHQQFAALGPQGDQLFAAVFGAVKVGLVGSLHDVFLLGCIISALGLVSVLFLPEVALRKTFAPAAAEEPPLHVAAAQVGQDAFPSLKPLRPEDQPAAALTQTGA